MNDKEIFRLGVIRDVCEKHLKRKDAAQLLKLSVRQVQRLMTRYRDLGAVGITHQRRGQSPGNKIDADMRYQCLDIIHKHYADFGPTLALEKLTECHGYQLSLETLRQWMIADGLWVPHIKRKPRVYQPRHRRDCYGELIQMALTIITSVTM